MKNHPFPPPKSQHAAKIPGFALVATLMLMLMLGLLAVGMLSLSSISLRSSGQDSALAEARSNARMALMLAVAEIQKNTGADTRVTAPADIVEADAPAIIGAWKSWEGKNHELVPNPPQPSLTAVRPIAPNYGLKDIANTSSDARFLSWLVSGIQVDVNGEPLPPSDMASSVAAPDGSTVPLLAEGSLKSADTRQIHVVPTALENGGRYAWWVSPENQKARLAQPHEPRTDDIAGWVEMGQSHQVANPDIFGLGDLLNDLEDHTPDPAATKPASRAITLGTSKHIAAGATAEPHQSFHDLSTNSVGLLTNTATGGWRKDLSILTEKWDAIYAAYPGGKLPLFRYFSDPEEPVTTSLVPKPVKPSPTIAATNSAALTAATPAQSNLYPWSNYSLILGHTQPGTYYAASASWASLQSFATSYKNFTYSSGGVKSPFVWDKIAKQNASAVKALEIYNHKHRQLLHPQIARFQLLVYARAVEDRPELNRNPKRYQMQLMYVPLFILWNPYNVALEQAITGTLNGGDGSGTHVNFRGVGWRRSIPGALAIADKAVYPTPASVPVTQFKMLTNGNFQTLDRAANNVNPYDNQLAGNVAKYGSTSTWKDLRTWGCWLPEGILTFKPGEAKVFSPDWVDNGYGFSGGVFRMKEGYNPTNIVGRDFNAVSNNLLANQSFWFLFRNDRVTQPYLERNPGNGFSVSFGDGGAHFGGTAKLPSAIGDEFHNITALADGSEGDKYWPPDDIDEVSYSVGELTGVWVPIFSMSFGPRITVGTAQGTNQNRPTKGVVQNNALAAMVLSEPGSGEAKDHPANNTFDFAYHSLPIGSTITPNLSNSAGYIATGYQSGDGLSRLIVDEIPLRPMASLVELQGWNPRGNNPYPPFQMNIIGNSDATPLIAKDKILPPTLSPSGDWINLQHDDAYCANHLLFDDWFVSSIAPQPQVLGGDIGKDMEVFYREFLAGTGKLANRSYQHIPEDPDEAVQKTLNSSDGWLKVASRLEVDGMFNVNSTSVDAWKAILGHAKSREKVALYGQNGIESATPSEDHPVTRGAVASDVEAGSGTAIAGGAANSAEYAGFRSLTDAQIADLADKIVEQVRIRGPFLSLAEFVNRQLSNDDDMALAGAVQTAINNLGSDPMSVLRNPANMLSENTMPSTDPKLDGADYQYVEASQGSSAYGAPGWIRQADVLRPIAPILSARDDTFTIRAYGDSVDQGGNVVAKAWCEAVVRRTRNFCDSTDAADTVNPPATPINQIMGRRYEIVTFRWLDPSEV